MLADVPADALLALAAAYAVKPAVLLVGWGLQRRRHGSATVRALDALGAISGNIGIPGGGVSYSFKRRGAFDLSFTQSVLRAPLAGGIAARRIAPRRGAQRPRHRAQAAPRTGLADEFSADAAAWKRRLLARVAARGAGLEGLRQGPVRNPLAPFITNPDRIFATPTGRANLVTDLPLEPPAGAPLRPLLLMALATERAQESQWRPEDQVGPATAIVHPAAAPGFADGDLATVESEVSSLTVCLCIAAGGGERAQARQPARLRGEAPEPPSRRRSRECGAANASPQAR